MYIGSSAATPDKYERHSNELTYVLCYCNIKFVIAYGHAIHLVRNVQIYGIERSF